MLSNTQTRESTVRELQPVLVLFVEGGAVVVLPLSGAWFRIRYGLRATKVEERYD
jgi:hypothetical protein